MTATHHIAQLNLGKIRAALDHPAMIGFTGRLDDLNELADAAEGFVWRLQTEDGDGTAIRVFEDPSLLVNLSVWESIDSLYDFTHRSAHPQSLRSRTEWFHRSHGAHQVLWWVPAGHLPDVREAGRRLEHLELHGPTSRAFTFAHRFDPPPAP